MSENMRMNQETLTNESQMSNEIKITETTEIKKVIDEAQVEKETSVMLLDSFSPIFQKAKEIAARASTIKVDDASQLTEMAQARSTRLEMRQLRIEADKLRKKLKEDSLRYGKAVQGVYNVIEFFVVPIEERLQEQEDFAKIQEAKRMEALREERNAKIVPLQKYMPPLGDLALMSEEHFLRLIAMAEKMKSDEEEKIAKEQAEKEAAELRAIEEREAQRKENERLKIEAEEARKKAEEEKRVLREQAEKERAERERIEREAKAKRDEEERIAAKKLAEEKRLKNAPDIEKLQNLSAQIEALELPEMAGEEAKKIIAQVGVLLEKVSVFIKSKIETL